MMTVFVNRAAVRVPEGTPAREVVAAHDAGLALRLDSGAAYVTDGRGIRLDPTTPLAPGGIIRVVVSARRGAEETRADA